MLDACGDLTIGALTDVEAQTVEACEAFLPAVLQVLRDRGHHALSATVSTAEDQWTAVACDYSDGSTDGSTDGYVIRTYGPFGGFEETWNEDPRRRVRRHNSVDQFLRYLHNARRKPLLNHLDTTTAYRELFRDEYRATCAVAVDGWWQTRMAGGHTFESAQMLLALALPTHLHPHLTYTDGTPTLTWSST